jgi:membrane-associated phospholipid phosphatase
MFKFYFLWLCETLPQDASSFFFRTFVYCHSKKHATMGALYINNLIFCCLHMSLPGRASRHALLLVMGLYLSGLPALSQTTEKDSLKLQRTGTPEIRQIVPAVLGLSMTAFLVDEPVNRFLRERQGGFLDQLSDLTDAGGEKTIVVPAILMTYGAARFLLKNERLEATALKAVQSVAVTALTTEGLKHLAGRSRPFNERGAYAFQPFPGGRDQYKSLPSGHASLAFALFTPFAEEYSRWIYLVPVSVAVGRVYQNKHWLSDVVLGGGIGFISGYLFAHHPNVDIIPGGLRVYF